MKSNKNQSNVTISGCLLRFPYQRVCVPGFDAVAEAIHLYAFVLEPIRNAVS